MNAVVAASICANEKLLKTEEQKQTKTRMQIKVNAVITYRRTGGGRGRKEKDYSVAVVSYT